MSRWHGEELDGELDGAMEYNNVTLSGPIVDILAHIEGQYDGADYHWLVLLESGRVAYVTGGCDYTGWDCQSNCEAFEEPDLKSALAQVPEAYRTELKEQLPRSAQEGL